MKKITLLLITFGLFYSSYTFSKDIPMRSGYRQLKLSKLPRNRNGSLITFLYSRASASNSKYKKNLTKNQELMIEAIEDSLKSGRVPMANSIWKRFVKSLSNQSKVYNINGIIFSIINNAYLGKKPKLAYRATLYKILSDKVSILENERDLFKEIEKNCEDNSYCDYNTKDEIDRTNDLWKRRTKIFDKEMKKAERNFKATFDEEDGHSRLVQHVGKLFFGSAEAIVSE